VKSLRKGGGLKTTSQRKKKAGESMIAPGSDSRNPVRWAKRCLSGAEEGGEGLDKKKKFVEVDPVSQSEKRKDGRKKRKKKKAP